MKTWFAVFALVAMLMLSTAIPPAQTLPEGYVTSLAGDGSAGFQDGDGAAARFMAPSGVAYDPRTQTIYVTDFAAQRVRKIDAAGRVTTVAGSGQPTASGLDVAGGYRDGPAASAQFNRPTGIAIAPDGSLYIADSFNHCIRKIAGGIVSTVAGKPDVSESKDGTLQDATFTEPHGLAFASDGTLYVADYGSGIRILAARGVTRFERMGPRDVESVSIDDEPDHRVLFFASQNVIGRYDFATSRGLNMSESTGFTGLYGYGEILSLDARYAIMSSFRGSSIDIADLDCQSPGPKPCISTFAGSDDEDKTQAGGFADGPLHDARFFTPLGMARMDRHTVVVADSSNRRIRKITFTNP